MRSFTELFGRLVCGPFRPTRQPPTEIMRHPLEVLAKFDQQLATDKIEGDSLSKFVDFLNQHLSVITPPRPTHYPCPTAAAMCAFFCIILRRTVHTPSLSAEALHQRKLETLFPAFEGPESDIKSFNSKQLTECDGVILCWASASEVWVRAQASGLRNWLALGRSQQFCYRAVVAAPPPGERKKASKLLFPP